MWDVEDIGNACFSVAVSVFFIGLALTATTFFIGLFWRAIRMIWGAM
jgi:hypothetical protein